MKKLAWLSAAGLGVAAAIAWRKKPVTDPYRGIGPVTKGKPQLELVSPATPAIAIGSGNGKRSTHAEEDQPSRLATYTARHRH